MEIDADDNLYVSGYTYGDLSGSNKDTSNSSGDVYVAKINSNFELERVVQYGTDGEDRSYIHLRDSIVYLAGMTEGSFVSTSNGSFDAFVLPLSINSLQPTVATPEPLSADVALSDLSLLQVYPNPSDNEITVALPPAVAAEVISMTLTDRLGKQVHRQQGFSRTLELTRFSPGLYILQVQLPKQRFYVQLVKQ